MSITKNSSSTSTLSVSRHSRAIVAVGAQTLVHFAHEAVEVGAALLAEWQRFEEQIDQESLAAADPAPQVQPLRRRLHRPAEHALQPSAWGCLGERCVQTVELAQRRVLRRIVVPVAAGDAGGIARGRARGRIAHGFAHAPASGSGR
jgi:hypothetical protein